MAEAGAFSSFYGGGYGLAGAGIGAVSSIVNGYFEGKTSYYKAKTDFAYQAGQLYSQAVPLYQQIGGQVTQLMHAQAEQYMDSGVDVSQGTAINVISHTRQQGDEKIAEIRNNINMTIQNMESMSSAQAMMGLMEGITKGVNGAMKIGGDYAIKTAKLRNQQKIDAQNKAKNQTTFNTNTNTLVSGGLYA